jgi:hypothetical protein
MRLLELFGSLPEVRIDNQTGWGEVPDNRNVDYLGLRVKVKPSVFLRLSHSLQDEVSPDILSHIKSGGAIAAPFLDIRLPGAWSDGDLSDDARVMNHEGRNRMTAILRMEGDEPIETHLFFRGGLRNRDLTPEIIERLDQSIIGQRGDRIRGPWFARS